ncbi:hypothetical protein HMI54_001775 [Coelomomyces lativittatus]|nr:hypothetical protein HMI55_000034 [Coelomomyces lativittatus]KAJ1511559.1 hypothetical protein HMI56_005240 [Coelomomyces lativittatus]KAJ1518246.1 hypothetical protein HMI54_001775 [Coelomomyces lativittatus]
MRFHFFQCLVRSEPSSPSSFLPLLRCPSSSLTHYTTTYHGVNKFFSTPKLPCPSSLLFYQPCRYATSLHGFQNKTHLLRLQQPFTPPLRHLNHQRKIHPLSSSTVSTSPLPVPPSPSPTRTWSNKVFSLSSVPNPPFYIGLAGLLPFFIPPICILGGDASQDIFPFLWLHVTYGASILTFLGAVHWGTAMAYDPSKVPSTSLALRYTYSVTPCIFSSLTFLCPLDVALLLQLVGFHGVLVVDYLSWRHHYVPEWYLPLRIWLTSMVTFCYFTSLWQSWVKKNETLKEIPPGI